MNVAIDANVLIRWSIVDRNNLDRARLESMLDDVSKSGGRVLIPMPCLAEFLVRTNDATSEWLQALERKRSILLAPFDRRSAVECALIDRAIITKGGDKKAGRTDSWQKVKFDRQILAVARANNATRLITNDEGLRSSAIAVGLTVLRLQELQLPESAKQVSLDFRQTASAPAAPAATPPAVSPGASATLHVAITGPQPPQPPPLSSSAADGAPL